MATCFEVPYTDRFGKHVATKWGESPPDALALVKKSVLGRGLPEAEFGVPVAVVPQPFAVSPPATFDKRR